MIVQLTKNQKITTICETPFWNLVQAESDETGKKAWFKILKTDWNHNKKVVQLFYKSAILSESLFHPNIIRAVEHGYEDDKYFILMNYFEGEQLGNLLKGDKIISEGLATFVILQVCKALQYAHLSGIVHGVLTPRSIYANPQGEVRILDFGSGELLNHSLQFLKQSSLFQYACYMHPESIAPDSSLTTNNDLYAVGVILYQMLTGQVPFHAKDLKALRREKKMLVTSPRALNPTVSLQMEKIIMRILEPEDRTPIPNISALIRGLQPQTVSVGEPGTKSKKQPRKMPQFIMAIGKKINSLTAGLSTRWVGSKKRMLQTLIMAGLLLFVTISIVIVSKVSSHSQKQVQLLYEEFLAGDQEKAAPSALSAAAPDTFPAQSISEPAAVSVIPLERAVEIPKQKQVTAQIQDSPKKQAVQPVASVQSLQVLFDQVDFADRIIVDQQQPAHLLPATINLLPGNHTAVYIDFSSSFTWQTQISVQPDIENKISFTPDQVGFGELAVILANSDQFGYAFVTIDNQSNAKQTTPFRKKIMAGRHRLAVFREGFYTSPADTTVTVTTNQEMVIHCRINPK